MPYARKFKMPNNHRFAKDYQLQTYLFNHFCMKSRDPDNEEYIKLLDKSIFDKFNNDLNYLNTLNEYFTNDLSNKRNMSINAFNRINSIVSLTEASSIPIIHGKNNNNENNNDIDEKFILTQWFNFAKLITFLLENIGLPLIGLNRLNLISLRRDEACRMPDFGLQSELFPQSKKLFDYCSAFDNQTKTKYEDYFVSYFFFFLPFVFFFFFFFC